MSQPYLLSGRCGFGSWAAECVHRPTLPCSGQVIAFHCCSVSAHLSTDTRKQYLCHHTCLFMAALCASAVSLDPCVGVRIARTTGWTRGLRRSNRQT